MNRINVSVFLAIVVSACGAPQSPVGSGPVGSTGTTGLGGVNDTRAIAKWDALSASEKDRVKAVNTLYLHQSVGQDLEDGCGQLGFAWEYIALDSGPPKAGLNGGIFNDFGGISNGYPLDKMDAFKAKALQYKASFSVVLMSFGYADVSDTAKDNPGDVDVTQQQLKDGYVAMVSALKAAGLRVVHVTPPLVYSTSENPPKLSLRQWMLATFANDVIFDLQEVESMDGGVRCEVGGVWRICQANRATAACDSDQAPGGDGDGAGHLCRTKAPMIAKPLLYSIYQAAL